MKLENSVASHFFTYLILNVIVYEFLIMGINYATKVRHRVLRLNILCNL